MNDVKKDPTVRIVFIILVAAAALVTLIVIFKNITAGGRLYTGFSVTARNDRKSSSNIKYIRDGKYLAAYSSEGITAYDASGNTVWSAGVSLEDPRAVCAGDFFVAADIGGRVLYVIDQSEDPATPVEVDTLADILEVSVSKNGRVAVLMQESSGYRIQLIDPYNNPQVMAEIVTTRDDGYALGLAISSDGTKLVTEYFKDENGTIRSNITFYNFSSIGENAGADRIVGAFPYNGELFGRIQFTDNNTVLCIGDSSIRVFSFTHEPSVRWQKKINGKIKEASADESGIGLILSANNETRAVAFSAESGSLRYNKKVDFDIYGMDFENNELLMYSNSKCRILRADGQTKYDGESGDEMIYITRTDVADKYFVVAGSHIDVVKLN